MTARFDSFVVFAEMRTGSNFLEANLNALDGVICHGEAFNPHFIGYPNCDEILGFSQKLRDRNPGAMLDALTTASGLNGFRYFHNHDPRIFERLVADTRCAKIILTRDPLDSYVSWKIAQTTGQWKLTDVKRRKDAQIRFDPLEYADHVDALKNFQHELTQKLQVSGQVAFRLSYDDLRSLAVINGLAAFLGVPARLEQFDNSLKVQNPTSVAEKVSNREEMEAALASRTTRDLDEAPNFEPTRRAGIQSYVAGAEVPLIFLPIPCGPTTAVTAWMAALDGVECQDLQQQMTRKALRTWKCAHPGHRSFTVVRHPLVRAHHAFCSHILDRGPQTYGMIRRTLRRQYAVPLPEQGPDSTYSLEDHRAAFMAFLSFLLSNLSGQTALRVDSSWCSQTQIIQGFTRFAAPDFIVREDELERSLSQIVESMGYPTIPMSAAAPDTPFTLDAIYDREMEALGAQVYQRDYMSFGFGPWR